MTSRCAPGRLGAGGLQGACAPPAPPCSFAPRTLNRRLLFGVTRALRCATRTLARAQDITRGRNMVDSVFQGNQGMGGTHNAILSSHDYISTAMRSLGNIEDGYCERCGGAGWGCVEVR